MLARLRRRPGLATARRSRRALVTAAAVIVVLAIAIGEVAADVVNSATPATLMQARSYIAAVVPVIDESTALVPWLREIRDEAPKLGRQGLLNALGRLVTGSANVQNQLATVGIPPVSRSSNELLTDAFGERSLAARTLSGAIALALDGSAGVGTGAALALSHMEAAAREVRRSDEEYVSFVRSVPPKVRRDTVALPSSSWESAGPWTAVALTAYVTTLGSDAGLTLHHDLTILAVTVQPPVLRITPTTTTTTSTTTTTTSTTSTTTTTTTVPGQSSTTTQPHKATTTTSTTSTSTTTTTLQVPPSNTTSWLAPTRRLTAFVVVANGGNVAERGVVVRATITPVVAPPTSAGRRTNGAKKTKATRRPVVPPRAESVRHFVGALGVGASIELQMPTFGVKPGFLYELTVTLSDPGGGPGSSDTKAVRIEIV
jgi:hypothetical protein